MGPRDLEQKMLKSRNLTDLGQRSNNDLDIWYSCGSVYSLSTLYVPTFISQTSIKSTILAFSHTNALGSKFDLVKKEGQGQLRIIICTNFVGPMSHHCSIPSFKVIGLLILEKIVKRFLWAWWPSLSHDQDHLYKLSFLQSNAPHEICLWLALRLRKCLEVGTDGRWTTETCYTMSQFKRKPVLAICEQQRCRSACAYVQSDQLLCCSLLRKYYTYTC